MKIDLALEELHRSENDLAHELLQVSERHKVDHEIYHLGRDLARWSQRHVREIADVGKNYGLDLDPEPEDEAGLAERLREKGAELIGRRGNPALLLLRDLREIYMKASGVSVDWELLAQAAQGIKHTDLLDVTKRCHPDTLRQMRWANAKLKESATQILVT
ncbi:hypothetical protein D477_015616 [Arthrobacter crystallopoietes BAB-32]|uniref:Uncharacterized protein n=1 Tax=Arthrobacter crystallopoietes BAB-32 TaxID=1246476 RepID=N1V508_9MICC|nr:hypothetical protein [Arthrobacter crystallopoietes]EMY33308.1 hypothetical protein D477_015616 [Arthrobacter crystallopoietes BAB-32]